MNFAMMLALVGALNATAMQGSTSYGGVDGWMVEQRDDGCFMTGFYDPQEDWRQEFTAFTDTEGQISLVFYDNSWTFEEGDRADLGLAIEHGEETSGWRELSGTVIDDGGEGRSIIVNFDLEASQDLQGYLVGARAIALFADEEPLISLDIDNNANAFALLAECVTKVG
jgi:hypothetical protein